MITLSGLFLATAGALKIAAASPGVRARSAMA
jgi:hypothetical protein